MDAWAAALRYGVAGLAAAPTGMKELLAVITGMAEPGARFREQMEAESVMVCEGIAGCFEGGSHTWGTPASLLLGVLGALLWVERPSVDGRQQ